MKLLRGAAWLSTALALSGGCVVSLSPVDEESSESGRPNLPDSLGSDDGSSSEEVGGSAGGGDGDGSDDGTQWWCEATADCDPGFFCWADYDEGNGDAPLPEDFACHFNCVPSNDPDSMTDPAESYWCIDDEGCCEPEASCGAMGYCSSP